MMDFETALKNERERHEAAMKGILDMLESFLDMFDVIFDPGAVYKHLILQSCESPAQFFHLRFQRSDSFFGRHDHPSLYKAAGLHTAVFYMKQQPAQAACFRLFTIIALFVNITIIFFVVINIINV